MTTFPIGDCLTLPAVVLATMAPFAAFAAIIVFTRSKPRLSAGLALGAVTISLCCALLLLGVNLHMEKPVQYAGKWLTSGSVAIPFGFLIDPLSLLMLVIVAGISFLVQIYSLGYMAGDPGFSRYYAFMSLFAWAMMNLTVSTTILQLYIFWELVGLSSYLLIGFWYEKFSATQAGKKAFVMTRTGDLAFFIGLLVVLLHMGNFGILDMNGPAAKASMSPAVLTLAALLIFGGIAGKSAQFPLLTWLPDAMEGTTPVSALLHSATMVAAGVYLFARLHPFFSLSPTAMSVILAIGTISMLLASTMAMVSRDIKKVWAYSTISQLGFMIMALAAGAYFAGVFHLATHAGFKALLFLCSGVFIHAHGTNDIFELGARGCRRMKTPAIAIAVGAAALSGLPPLSGYFSKEAIMAGLGALPNPLWLAAGLLGVFLTAYYSFRVIFVVFLYPGGAAPAAADAGTVARADAGGASSPHGGSSHRAIYRRMCLPLVVLVLITVFSGFLKNPLAEFLMGSASPEAPPGVGPWWVGDAALALAAAGVLTAFLEFGRRGARQIGFVERFPRLHKLFEERWYIDHFYRFLVSRVVDRGIAALCYRNDNEVIDGAIEGICKGTVESGRMASVLNSGMIQYRLLISFAVLVFLLLYVFF